MAEAFLQVLLDNLSSLIQKEIGTIMGVDDEMKKLSSTLTTIQAVLEDAEDKQLKNKPIRIWLRKLNDLAYEIDDILDECATEVSKSQSKSSILNRYSLKKILYRRKIGRQVQEVTDRLDAVAAERSKFHLREMEIQRTSEIAARRETGSILNEPHDVYGRDEEKEKIVDILVNHVRDCQQLSILPIIGIGGLGKTTLAQLVFKDSRITEHFDTKIWVCVSEKFDVKTLIKAVIESATESGCASHLVHLDALQHRVWELLNQKRYLLILDDVWNDNQEKWAMLKNVLACGSRGSSIVVTTRLRKVADIMGTLTTHRLTELSKKHCWLLFRQRAFGQEMEKYPNLEAIGKEIVKKCGGVPLAAKALGGLLRFKRNEKEWVYVKESDMWNLPHEETSILPALRLSYHHLPLQLRQCFAYCAIFPKNSMIDKEELIFHWMAHGYISSNGRMDVEDVGNEVWNELVLRSLFQDVSSTHVGKTYFIIHDLVHDLAQSIMENKVPGAQMESSDQSASNSNAIRQVHLGYHFVAFPTSFQFQMDMSSILMSFSRLRILDASRTDMEDLPSAIGSLQRLRYLNLSNLKFRILPSTICRLWNLKILNLIGCFNLVSLPKNMRYMNNLRHLFLDQCKSLSHMPPNIGKLISLRTLSVFVVGEGSSNQLGELKCLNLGGGLQIQHLERVRNHTDAKKANLVEKPNLRNLVLQWKGNNTCESPEEMDEKVLEALEPHPNIETLRIFGFKGKYFPNWMGMGNVTKILLMDFPNCLRLTPLGDLPRLKSLKLKNLPALEYVMENEVQGGDGVKAGFLSLKALELYYLPNLRGLLKEEVGEIYPSLQMLHICSCPLLELPPLSSLNDLVAQGCSSLNLNSFNKLDNLTFLSVVPDNNPTTYIPKEILEKLSNLKMLYITNAKEHCLPIEGLQGLNSLATLQLSDCQTTCLPDEWLRHLAALERLYIGGGKELVELPEGVKFLHSLKYLTLAGLPKMRCVPEVLRHVPSLQDVQLSNLAQLTSLPDWLGNLTSLEVLFIYNCPRLAALPASIQGMTNLRSLTIVRNVHPELRRRCEKEKGEDWHKIAHIPNLTIKQLGKKEIIASSLLANPHLVFGAARLLEQDYFKAYILRKFKFFGILFFNVKHMRVCKT